MTGRSDIHATVTCLFIDIDGRNSKPPVPAMQGSDRVKATLPCRDHAAKADISDTKVEAGLHSHPCR